MDKHCSADVEYSAMIPQMLKCNKTRVLYRRLTGGTNHGLTVTVRSILILVVNGKVLV